MYAIRSYYAVRTVIGRYFEYHRLALAVEFGHQLIDQVAIENLAVDVFPARVRRADTA